MIGPDPSVTYSSAWIDDLVKDNVRAYNLIVALTESLMPFVFPPYQEWKDSHGITHRSRVGVAEDAYHEAAKVIGEARKYLGETY